MLVQSSRSASDAAKTCSITWSIGGSSIVRSATGSAASSRLATAGVSAFGTRTENPVAVRSTSAPLTSSTGSGSGTCAPSSSSTVIVLCAAKRWTSPVRSPS